MKRFVTLLFCLGLRGYAAYAQAPVENYPVDSASVVHANVPKGEVLKFVLKESKIFPGQMHEYSVYIPKQYDGSKPACVYINQDGLQGNANVAFDNLINSKEMPVTIGVFVSPGRMVADDPNTALDRYNRSFEYDGLGDAYARFLLEELLPDVERHKASDGREIHLSKNGNDRCIAGQSSGAIAAFTAAWERPDEFSKVVSGIGTYVGLRGGDRYPGMIRKFETKPIKVFLQDGSNDQNSYAGDWFFANQMMERSLIFAGNPVTHAWGQGVHSGKMANAILPDMMRWIWKDYPKPVELQKTKNPYLADLLIPGEGWQLVGSGYGFTEGPAVNAQGEVFFNDIPNGKSYKIGADGKPLLLNFDSKKANGLIFGPDGNRYAVATGTSQIIRYDADNKAKVIAEGIAGNDIVIAKNGNMYITAPDGTDKPGKVYLVKPNGDKKVVDEGLKFPNGLALTPDQSQLYVTEAGSHWVYLFKVNADGSLTNKQRYIWLYTPDAEDNAFPDGMRCDTAGHVYIATHLGIQIADQAGRVNAIIPMPDGGIPSNITFGGPNFDVMYVTCQDKVYRRRVNARGVNGFEAPHKPKRPSL